MRFIATLALAGMTLFSTMTASATNAEARRWRGDRGGAAVALGVAAVIAGIALSRSHRRHYSYYDDGYYGDDYYYAPRRYYRSYSYGGYYPRARSYAYGGHYRGFKGHRGGGHSFRHSRMGGYARHGGHRGRHR